MTNNPSNSFQIGTVLNNKWVILEFIAKGGMGEVYRAHQLNLKRDIAIKVVSREWLIGLDGDEEEIETSLQRFRREVESMARIRHSNILQIFDYDSIWVKEDNKNMPIEYIVMEYIPGSTLRSTMSEEGFYPEEDLCRSWVVDCFLPILEGVGAMHDLDMVHRDLKPENVLMDGSIPKIADFGLVASCRWKSVTQSIHVMGTAAYMSPEQFMDFGGADQRTDIYSLGKILFEAIDGKITSKTIPMKSAALTKAETPLFKRLDRIIRNATAENKEDRFQSIADFRNAILEAISTEGWKHREELKTTLPFTWGDLSAHVHRKWTWLSFVFAFIAAGIIGLWLWRLPGEPGKSAHHMKVPLITQEADQPETSMTSGEKARPAPPPAQTLESKDDMTLHLIPGGRITLPANLEPETGNPAEVAPFYMDETPVTNHQYVEFLNMVLPEIQVEKGTVKADDEIWFLLGEVMKGYEPIVLRDGTFHIKKPAHASCPVLRVTGYGSSAYARFYGKRLPSAVEWFYAARKGADPHKKPARDISSDEVYRNRDVMMGGMMNHMMGNNIPNRDQPPARRPRESASMPVPVILSEPNIFGIRGLNENISEWVLRLRAALTSKNTPEAAYAILGQPGSSSTGGDATFSAVLRKPWEAFESVGFRCVISAVTSEKKSD